MRSQPPEYSTDSGERKNSYVLAHMWSIASNTCTYVNKYVHGFSRTCRKENKKDYVLKDEEGVNAGGGNEL